MKIENKDALKSNLLSVACTMAGAANTAPKAKGVNNIETLILDGEDISPLVDELKVLFEESGKTFFQRDALNLENSPVVLLIGVRFGFRGVPHCGLCGNVDCATNKERGGICSYDTTDLGIAVGYASAIALDHRVDHRVFFTAGKAAKRLGLLPDCGIIYALPLSSHGKNIYYDRG